MPTKFDMLSKDNNTDVWLTPPIIIDSLGKFDLDPCSPIDRPWNTATKHLTIEDDGLNSEWHGRVWLNPPYGRETIHWIRRLREHKNGIALIFARTDTKTFHDHIFPYADSIFFFGKRLQFFNSKGTKNKQMATSPSVLVAYGHYNTIALSKSGLNGKHILLK